MTDFVVYFLVHERALEVVKMERNVVYHGRYEDVPIASATETLGSLTRAECLEHGWVQRWNTGPADIDAQLKRLTDEQKAEIVEFLRLRRAGYATGFLEGIDKT